MLRLSVSPVGDERSITRRVDALKGSIHPQLIQRTIRKVGRRTRACPLVSDEMAAWLVVGLGLFFTDALRQVWRWLVPSDQGAPRRSTLCMARQRLGPRVLIELAKQVLRPLADDTTQGACYHGLPLRAIDCCNLSLYDSPANRKTFSPQRVPKRKRRHGRRPPPVFPQAKLCCLCEVGTHAALSWGLKPMYWADCKMATPLLKHLSKGQLLLWDAAFYSRANLAAIQAKGAHVLGRLAWSTGLQVVTRLADGSYLARLPAGRRGKAHLRQWGPTVRIIEYELHHVASTHHKKHRLMTTLLDAAKFPAAELAELYHQRWELELMIDELETHQLQQRLLVSQTPAGVVQEVAGLLIAHWLVRKLMFDAAAEANVSPLRLSFVGTLKLLRCRLGEASDTATPTRDWWRRLVSEIARDEVIEPRRPRINPRVLKLTNHDFPRKRPQHKPSIAPKFVDAFHVLR
ncbi:MAG TPA: IS4 family transposase [Chloroflexota bacterium]|nr:IS4 family transposase [Chloroflexota bacterium]